MMWKDNNVMREVHPIELLATHFVLLLFSFYIEQIYPTKLSACSLLHAAVERKMRREFGGASIGRKFLGKEGFATIRYRLLILTRLLK